MDILWEEAGVGRSGELEPPEEIEETDMERALPGIEMGAECLMESIGEDLSFGLDIVEG